MSLSSAVCPLLVGRGADVARLEANLDSRVTTLIAGAAGVGKSRLAQEASRLARERGMVRLVGHCAPDPTVPYAPFVTALRRHTRTLDEPDLLRLFEGSAFLAAALLPEAAVAVGLAGETPRQDDLFAAVWQVVRRLAAPGGCLLLLEDLHWADVDSLRLFSYLAEELADLDLWLVGTYRADELHRHHPLTEVLATLARDRAFDEIAVHPLGREDLRFMVSAIFDGTEVGDEFVDVLSQRTDGNPFFVEELVKVLLERGDIYHEAGDWARRDLVDIDMPLSVRETLLARARTLDPRHLELLQLAAAAGDEFDLPVLSHASGLDVQTIGGIVSEGLRLQLLTERREGAVTTYAFRHALTREAFAEELVGPDRQRAHRRIAEGIRRTYASDLDRVAAELADHYAAAGDTSEAVEFAARAARLAAATGSIEETGRLFERALRLMGPDDPRHLPMLLEAADTLIEGSDRRLATAFVTEARQLARAARDQVAEARALSVLQRFAWDRGDTGEATSLLQQAFTLVRGKADQEEGMIVARLARILTLGDRHDEAAELVDYGIELTSRTGDDRALSWLYGTRMLIAGQGPDFESAFEAADEAARASRDGAAARNLATNAGYMTLWCGDFTRSRQLLRRAIDLHEQFAPNDTYPHAGYAWLLSLMGEYEDAVSCSGRIGAAGRVPTRIVGLTARYEVAERRGDLDAGEIAEELWALAVQTGESQRSVPALAARARHLLLHDGLDAALPLFWDAAALTTAATSGGSHWPFSPDLARALCDEGRADELERWNDSIAGLTAMDDTAHNRAAGELTVAHLAMVRGDHGAARRSFSSAAERFEALPCPARLVEALTGLAELEWRADQPDAASRAARRALDVAKRIGADALVARARQALDQAETPSVLATVLFTDLVSSTERLSTVGDREWTAVLRRHHALIRRELERFRGREIDSIGDGFLAMFDSPAQAIRCAVAIRDGLASGGLDVRAGLHTGECQLIGDKLSGLAVHIAARVSSAARGGEILVSSTVRDLVVGSGLTFLDRGPHQLKGIPGDWTLYEVG